MQNTAPKGGAGSDDPTGRDRGRNRPVEHSARSFVRTSFSNGERIDSCDDNQSCLCSSSRRSCSSRSTATVPIGAVGAVLDGAEAAAGANGGRNNGRKRGLAPDPTGGAASRRDPNERAVAVRWAVDAVCCGSLGCREESGLLSVTVDGEKRVLCAECAAEFAGVVL